MGLTMRLTKGEILLAIHQTHDCQGIKFIEATKVKLDRFANEIEVFTVEIEGHPTSSRCFAWGVEYSSTRIGIPAVLMTETVRTAHEAVKEYYRDQA